MIGAIYSLEFWKVVFWTKLERRKKVEVPNGMHPCQNSRNGWYIENLMSPWDNLLDGFSSSHVSTKGKKIRSWVHWTRVPNNVHRSISNIQLTCFQNPTMYIEASRTFKLHVSKSILYIPYSLPEIRYIMKK
jgi:hypothetical protein